jgi:predicted phage terminase large subunit-like protein
VTIKAQRNRARTIKVPLTCSHRFIRARNGGVCTVCTTLPAPPTLVQRLIADPELLLQTVQRERLKRRADKSRNSLAEFFRAAWHVLEPSTPLNDNWHIDAIADHLQAVFFAWQRRKTEPTYRPDLQNFLCNVPPGTSKSRLISVAFNAWAWLHDPNFSIIAVSSNPSVALRDADHVRALIESDWYRSTFEIDWLIRPDKSAVGSFQIVRFVKRGDVVSEVILGSRQSKGMTAKVTGQRADCLIVDDPHDAAEVFSKAKREEVINKWDNALCNRVNDLGSSIRIGVMQRLHAEDWSAHVLAQTAQRWLHLWIPLLFDQADRSTTAIGWTDPRSDGDNLHLVRFPDAFVASERERLGSYAFEAQYNQRTTTINGGIIRLDWFRWFRFDGQIVTPNRPRGSSDLPSIVVAPNQRGKIFDAVYASIDASFKETETGSECAVLVIATRGPDYFLLDDRTAAMDFVKAKQVIRDVQREYNCDAIYVEDKANGTAIMADLSSEFSNLVSVEPDGGKEARAWAVSPIVESGHVYVLEGAAWITACLSGDKSIPVFPNGRKDDRMDAFSQALTKLKARLSTLSRWTSLAQL